MKKLPVVLGLCAALAIPVAAAEDPIAARQALMSSNGAAAAAAGGMMKGEIAYSPVVAKSTLATLAATAIVFGDFFPEGSFDPARSKAAEAIWTDRAGFDAEIAKFRDAAAGALAAAGREGPAELATFQAQVGPVLQTCQSCHEGYQIPN